MNYRYYIKYKEQVVQLLEYRIIIGTKSTCQIVIKDNSGSVNEEHCEITTRKTHGFLKNLNPGIITKINEKEIGSGDHKIKNRDKIKIGSKTLTFLVKEKPVETIEISDNEGEPRPSTSQAIPSRQPVPTLKLLIPRGPKPTNPVKPTIKRDHRLAELRSKGYFVDNLPHCKLPGDFNHNYFCFKSMINPYRYHKQHYHRNRPSPLIFRDYDSDD